ncbi:MAG TPA: STAS/SEC14 domain-containing protein [Mucilaginibacter sp.]|nr:STAS/SEC14 domain-containing protein [Mucilaginibacter sp.]
MLELISDLPSHVAGLHTFAEVDEREYEEAIVSLIDELLKKNRKINFVLVLESDIRNCVGAWCGNIRIGFKYLFKWGRVALVTDQHTISDHSEVLKYVIPGKFKYFPLVDLAGAIKWVSFR